MAGKRQSTLNLMAAKGDIVKDIVADTISKKIAEETGLPCNGRENTLIRVNIIKLENLVKEYDLNNPNKEVHMYDPYQREHFLTGVGNLKTIDVVREDLEIRKNGASRGKKKKC